MSNSVGSPIPAGWYRDPAGSEQLRWWDGTAWTAHLAPAPTPQPAPIPVVAAPVATPVIQAPVFTSGYGQTQAIAPVQLPEERPYVPFQNSWNGSTNQYGAGASGDFVRPAQWNTAGIWFVATWTFWVGLIIVVVSFIIGLIFGAQHVSVANAGTSYGYLGETIGYVVGWILLVVAAARDGAALTRMGYPRSTSVLWILLLPPLVYLIIRTVRVKSESGRGLAPLIFYIVSSVVVGAITVGAFLAFPSLLAAESGLSGPVVNRANATSLASGITTGLDKNGGNYTVTCTPFAKPTTQPINVSCTAVDASTNLTHTMIIEVDPGTAGGQPTVKLLSVTPPISH
jgi:Protein of unknown function (DUF2510)